GQRWQASDGITRRRFQVTACKDVAADPCGPRQLLREPVGHWTGLGQHWQLSSPIQRRGERLNPPLAVPRSCQGLGGQTAAGSDYRLLPELNPVVPFFLANPRKCTPDLATAEKRHKMPKYPRLLVLFGGHLDAPVNRFVVGSSPTRGAC